MLRIPVARASYRFSNASPPRLSAQKGTLMALTLQSLAAAARRKTLRAKEHVEAAEADLQDANKHLEQAIPLGDTDEIKQAHEQTQRAEAEVAKAAKELQSAEQLLVDHVTHAAKHFGEGVESVIDQLSAASRKKD